MCKTFLALAGTFNFMLRKHLKLYNCFAIQNEMKNLNSRAENGLEIAVLLEIIGKSLSGEKLPTRLFLQPIGVVALVFVEASAVTHFGPDLANSPGWNLSFEWICSHKMVGSNVKALAFLQFHHGPMAESLCRDMPVNLSHTTRVEKPKVCHFSDAWYRKPTSSSMFLVEQHPKNMMLWAFTASKKHTYFGGTIATCVCFNHFPSRIQFKQFLWWYPHVVPCTDSLKISPRFPDHSFYFMLHLDLSLK